MIRTTSSNRGGGRFITLAFLAVFLSSLTIDLYLPKPVSAISGSDFQAGSIISDAVFTNASAMSAGDIQNFLNAKVPSCDTNGTQLTSHPNGSGGYYTRAQWGSLSGNATPYTCLRNYVENPSTHQNNFGGGAVSGGISAAQIIWNAAQQYQINPEVIITTLQKEQGLVTDDWPWYGEYKAAMGYGCPDTAACDSKYYGFFNQVDNAAWQFRYYIDHPNAFNYWLGNNYIQYNPDASCGGSIVNIQTRATAALYIYTPYQPNAGALGQVSNNGAGGTAACGAYGNRNFWWYFTSWFGSTQTTTPYAWTFSSSLAYTDAARTTQYSASPALAITPGGTAYITLQARNNGNQSWSQSVVHLGATSPQDRSSAFSDGSWVNSSRIAFQQTTVAPGDVGTFMFDLKAPQTPGSYTECFNLVADGITWMAGPNPCYNIDVVASQDSNDQNLSLAPGQILNVGSYVMAPSARSILTMQGDGNVVLYSDNTARWNTGTGSTGGNHLVMQTDGNLVLYNKAGAPLWNSATSGNPNARTVLQSDGNLVIYSASDVPLWSSGTIHTPSYSSSVVHYLKAGILYPQQSLQMANRSHVLMMQRDGNLVLYSNGHPIWASYTQSHPGAFAVIQADGNFVVYSASNQPLWASYTNNNPGSTLMLQDDGNLVMYSAGNKALWHTQTYGK